MYAGFRAAVRRRGSFPDVGSATNVLFLTICQRGKNRPNPTGRISNWTTNFNELTWPAATALALTGPGDEEHSGEDSSTPILRRGAGARRFSLLTLQERTVDDEIQLISDGDGLAVIGDPAVVERFLAFEGLSSEDLGLPRLGAVLSTGAAAAQAGSEIAANSGRWVKLTKESAR